jgi:bifunctional DNA-binding transcriptional regulator/antitoxin component of YhaV-PrlF toxin-antitoxin module
MRKLKEKNIRKLTRVGRGSFCITIPIEIIEKLKWKERQKVVVRLSGKKIVIEDWKK